MQPFPVSSIDREAAEPRNRQSYQEPCGVTPARLFAALQCNRRPPHAEGVTMNTGLYRIELTGPGRLAGRLSAWQESWQQKAAVRYLRSRSAWLLAVLMIGFGAWVLLFGYGGRRAESQPVPQAISAAVEPAQSPVANAAQDQSQDQSLINPTATPAEGSAPAEAAPVDGLKIASQSWRRGGLGSNALVTFTLRNGNDYAVRDIEISCAFTRSDGSHLTDRTRIIPDTVDMKSRKTFARMHIGFVNINASKAKCSLVAASRI
jgi:hypothetical protein